MTENPSVPDVPFIPAPGCILVLQDEAPKESQGGLHLPTMTKPETGTVVAVYQDPEDPEDDAFRFYYVGDKVYFQRYASKPISIEGVDYLVFEEEDLLGKAPA
jgi:co-chaperonin GroES (HSP10)